MATDTDYGTLYGAQVPADEGTSYWRLASFLFPFYTMIPSGILGAQLLTRIWVPIDDETCWLFTYSWHPSRPMSEFAREVDGNLVTEAKPGHAAHWVPKQPGTHKPRQSRDNDYEIDREDQKYRTYSGIKNASIQDRAIQETMGAIYDRTKEHLGSADTAIIAARRLLLQAVRDVQAGRAPQGSRGEGCEECRCFHGYSGRTGTSPMPGVWTGPAAGVNTGRESY